MPSNTLRSGLRPKKNDAAKPITFLSQFDVSIVLVRCHNDACGRRAVTVCCKTATSCRMAASRRYTAVKPTEPYRGAHRRSAYGICQKDSSLLLLRFGMRTKASIGSHRVTGLAMY